MCGRFTLTTPTDELAEYFRILEDGLPSARGRLGARYNIAPTQPVACVRRAVAAAAPGTDAGAAGRELVEMRWGLIPFWAKDPAIGNRLINARAETVAEKPAYKEAFRRRRCLVVADGFYEWQRRDKGPKQPYFIYLKEREPFAFAGLWEHWKPRGDQLRQISGPERPDVPLSDDGRVVSCAFLTTEPNEKLATIHDRMPVILPREHWDAWLDPELDDVAALEELLGPYPAEAMDAHPVSTRVNKPAHDDPKCIEPVARLKIVRPADQERSESTPNDRKPTQESLF